MSARAVEIASNNAQAEVAPLRELAATLAAIKAEGGSECLRAYLRNLRVPLYRRAGRVIQSQTNSQVNGGASIMLIIPAFMAGLVAIPILLGLARLLWTLCVRAGVRGASVHAVRQGHRYPGRSGTAVSDLAFWPPGDADSVLWKAVLSSIPRCGSTTCEARW